MLEAPLPSTQCCERARDFNIHQIFEFKDLAQYTILQFGRQLVHVLLHFKLLTALMNRYDMLLSETEYYFDLVKPDSLRARSQIGKRRAQ